MHLRAMQLPGHHRIIAEDTFVGLGLGFDQFGLVNRPRESLLESLHQQRVVKVVL